MPKPTPRPNLIHQQLLGGLIETKLTSWFHKTIDPKTDDVVKTKVSGTELVCALAQNVSWDNVERAMNRWTP